MAKALTEAFSTFLHRRRARRHFERRPLLDTLAAAPQGTRVAGLGQDLLAAARDEPAAALARLRSQADGLDSAEAARRLQRDGPNEVQHEPPLPGWLHLWRCYLNPFNLLLTALALLSFLSADAKATVVIAVMVALEHRHPLRAGGSLAPRGRRPAVAGQQHRHRDSPAGAAPAAHSRRDAGDRAARAGRGRHRGAVGRRHDPGRLPRARAHATCSSAESAMTGESLPVEKFVQRRRRRHARDAAARAAQPASSWAPTSSPARPPRWWWPPARARYFGTLAAQATATDAHAQRLPGRRQQRQLAADPLCGGDGADRAAWSTASPRATGCEAFLFALSVAVGLTPEMLPMIVTSTLAKGAVLLSRKKVVVKRLDAIQNLGAMDILCTDKTGTLTQDKIALARHADAFGQDVRRGAELRLPEQPLPDRAEEPARPRRARARGRGRRAEAGAGLPQGRRDPVRLRAPAHVGGGVRERDAPPRADLQGRGRGGAGRLHAGACADARRSGAQDVPLDAAMLARVAAGARASSTTRACAWWRWRSRSCRRTRPPIRCADEAGADADRLHRLPRPAEGIGRAGAAGSWPRTASRVKVLTGDNELVARAGLPRRSACPATRCCSARRSKHMDDAALTRRPTRTASSPSSRRCTRSASCARCVPTAMWSASWATASTTRRRCVRPTSASRSTAAVDIAKEAADIILLEKSLLVLDEGVVEGRTTFCNMLKYIRMTASSNFGNVLSRAGGQRLPALPADAAAAAAGAEPAVRHRPDRHPVRQRRCRAGDAGRCSGTRPTSAASCCSSGRSARCSTSSPSP